MKLGYGHTRVLTNCHKRAMTLDVGVVAGGRHEGDKGDQEAEQNAVHFGVWGAIVVGFQGLMNPIK